MENLGRHLILGGVVIVLVGVGVYLAAKSGLPLGRLPGDIRMERDGNGFYFPLTSTVLVSATLTVVVNIILRILGR